MVGETLGPYPWRAPPAYSHGLKHSVCKRLSNMPSGRLSPVALPMGWPPTGANVGTSSWIHRLGKWVPGRFFFKTGGAKHGISAENSYGCSFGNKKVKHPGKNGIPWNRWPTLLQTALFLVLTCLLVRMFGAGSCWWDHQIQTNIQVGHRKKREETMVPSLHMGH